MKKSLVICYLVTDTIRMLELVIFAVIYFIGSKIIFGVINVVFVCKYFQLHLFFSFS